MSPDAVKTWAEAYRKAWEQKDSAAAADLFTEDASYRANIYEEPHRGRSGVVAYWESVTAEQSNVVVNMGKPYVDGQRAVVEFWTKMLVAEEPVTLSGALLLEFSDDGLCRSLREYWNFTESKKDPPPGWGH